MSWLDFPFTICGSAVVSFADLPSYALDCAVSAVYVHDAHTRATLAGLLGEANVDAAIHVRAIVTQLP